MDDRNALLQSVADDVTKHVLYDNYLQVQILSQEQAVSHLRMEHYEDLMTELEASGMLDRELESLPSSRGDGRALSATVAAWCGRSCACCWPTPSGCCASR